MLWALALVWLVYCVPVAPTWCYVWVGLRCAGHSRLASWAVASVLALLWFVFLPVHRRLNVRAVEEPGDQIAREFKSVYG